LGEYLFRLTSTRVKTIADVKYKREYPDHRWEIQKSVVRRISN